MSFILRNGTIALFDRSYRLAVIVL